MKKFVFSSYPDFSDNSWSIFIEMLRLEIEGNYIWLYKNIESVEIAKKKISRLCINSTSIKIKFVKKNTIYGLYNYISSNYVFTTHGMFEQIPLLPYQIKVNLWHGMPLKKIGKYDDKNKIKLRMNYTLSNGKLFDDIIMNSFDISKDQLLRVGSPRNDVLYKKSNFSFSSIFMNKFETILWMPTYRKSIHGDIRNDGLYQKSKIAFCDINDFECLNEELLKRKKNILIKLHPMDILNKNLQFIDKINKLSNIEVISENSQWLNEIEFYEILRPSIALITDYSSIIFDYILLEKPIGLLAFDNDEYQSTRGLIYEVESSLNILQINNFDEMIQFINSLDKHSKIDSLELKKLYQSYDLKGENAKKILNELNLI